MPYLLLAFCIGCMIPLQAAINSQLKTHLGGSTLLASFISLDHNGRLGLAVREITPTRLAGCALVVAGVLLVNFDPLFSGASR